MSITLTGTWQIVTWKTALDRERGSVSDEPIRLRGKHPLLLAVTKDVN